MVILSEKIRKSVIGLHIIEEGVSVYSEKFSELFDIDDMLVMVFISALYSYTFAIGKDYIHSIDFVKYKFLFKELFDGRLLVLITDGALSQEEEKKLLEQISLRYEVRLDDPNDFSKLKSLLDEEKSLIPIEIIADIKRKRRKRKQEQAKQKDVDKVPVAPTLPSVPKIKTEEFYFNVIGELKINEEDLNKIKQVLGNFFLGYKELKLIVIILEKNNVLITLIFGRIKEEELEEYLNPIFSTIERAKKDKKELLEIKIGIDYFLSISAFKEFNASAFTLCAEKKALLEIHPHIRRIAKFLNKIIK